VNLNGHDIQECQEKQKPVSAAASLPVCYRRAAAKILKELILLTELAHSNIVEVWHFMTLSYLSCYFSVCSAQHTVHTPYRDMLPHHRITNYDVTLPNVLISIILKPGSIASSLMMVVDRNM